MDTERIRELTSAEEVMAAFSLLAQLNTDLTEEEFRTLLPRVRADGYRLFALFVAEEMVAVAGIKRGVSFSSGEYVYVDDIVTDPDCRSRGYGSELLAFVHDWARSRGCEAVRLVASTRRTGAHRFYEEKMGYERRGYYFKKSLDEGS